MYSYLDFTFLDVFFLNLMVLIKLVGLYEKTMVYIGFWLGFSGNIP